MRSSNQLWIILLVLVVLIYLRYYVKVNSNFDILQIPVSSLKLEHLTEKSPIVISESIVNVNAFINTVFKFLYIFKNTKTSHQMIASTSWNTNKAKYTIFVCNKNNGIVSISHPKHKSTINPPFIDISLTKNQVLILPAWWRYKIPD